MVCVRMRGIYHGLLRGDEGADADFALMNRSLEGDGEEKVNAV